MDGWMDLYVYICALKLYILDNIFCEFITNDFLLTPVTPSYLQPHTVTLVLLSTISTVFFSTG